MVSALQEPVRRVRQVQRQPQNMGPPLANPGHPCYSRGMDREFPPLHSIHEARIEELAAQVASLADRMRWLEAENARLDAAMRVASTRPAPDYFPLDMAARS